MKILMFSVKDFAGISEASVSPGKVTIFAGGNKAGKTSLLKAIRACLEGADPVEIRKGSDRAEIVVDLEDIKVTRRITEKGQRVKVTNAENFERPAPQAYLNSLLGTIAFNPMEFYRAKKAERTKMLLEAVGQTVTSEEIIEACGEVVPGMPVKGPALLLYDIAHKHFYSARHAKNKELLHARELAKAAREKVPEGYHPDPAVEEKMQDLRGRAEAVNRKIAALETEKAAAERAEKTRARIMTEQRELREVHIDPRRNKAQAITLTDSDLVKADALVAELEEKLRVAKQNYAYIAQQIQHRATLLNEAISFEQTCKRNEATLQELPPPFDELHLAEARQEAEGLDAEARALAQHISAQAEFDAAAKADAHRDFLEEEAEILDEKVILFRDVLPAKSLSEAKLPIEGLRIEGDDVTVNGISIDNRSGSEKMQLSLSIARALAAECPLKMICVDGIEQLDEESLDAFEKEAAGDEFQYFGTRVGKPREGEIEVAGGKVVAR